jgi:hypothetical protein
MQEQRKSVSRSIMIGIDASYEVPSKELCHNQLWSLLDACSQPLKNAKNLQSRMMKAYNEDSGDPSAIVICPLYPHGKVSKKGSLLVLTNALQQAGFLHEVAIVT